jgi:hypothetical protein
VRQTTVLDWARLAVDCQHFDQLYLIRDFLAFSGLSPTDYHGQHSRARSTHQDIEERTMPPVSMRYIVNNVQASITAPATLPT